MATPLVSSYLLDTPLCAVGLLRYDSYRLHVGAHVVTASHPFAAVAIIVGAWRPSAHGVSPDDDSADDGSKRVGDVTASFLYRTADTAYWWYSCSLPHRHNTHRQAKPCCHEPLSWKLNVTVRQFLPELLQARFGHSLHLVCNQVFELLEA
jgi:hypothetical protein